MAEAVKQLWPEVKLGIGPSIEDGFYYDFDKKEPFTDEDLAKITQKMQEIITTGGGEIINVENWGKKKLAYPLKRFLEGNYILIKFKMNAMWSKELENNLQISENVLRHLLIKLGD